MIKQFLRYIEIKTKITSIFPFVITIAYLVYIKQPINYKITVVFFCSLFLFDLATTAINNYVDTKTNDNILQFTRKTARIIILTLLVTSVLLGLWLVFMTDIVVFFIGGICFFCGIFYTFGPIPISRLPLGEIFSGVLYGLLIPFLLLYINMPENTYLTFHISFQTIDLKLQIFPLITVFLLSITPICTTANIMLTNNICDLKEDIMVKRYTLPYYLGKGSLYLFAGLYYLAYLPSVLLPLLGIIHPAYLLTLLTLPFVQNNISLFLKKQEKTSTFLLSIKNYLLIMVSNSFIIFCIAFFKK